MSDAEERPTPVIGIGYSGGGLEALSTLLGALPDAPGLILVVSHATDREGAFPEVIQRMTGLVVVAVDGDQRLAIDHLYMAPAGQRLRLVDGMLQVESGEHDGRSRAVDTLFRSLAQAHGEASAAVVLSGTGTDGAAGIKEVRGVGGTTLAQDPDTAEHPSMPRAALQTGMVDYVLAPAEIAGVLVRLARHAYLWGDVERSRDADDRIVYTHGDLNPFLEWPRGEPTARAHSPPLPAEESTAPTAGEYAEVILDASPLPLVVLDEEQRVEYANPAYYAAFEARPEETVGRPLRELGQGRWDEGLASLLHRLGPERESFFDVELEQRFEEVGERVLLVDGRRLDGGRILLSIRDITDRKRFEEGLAAANERLEERVRQRTEKLQAQAATLRTLASRMGEAEQRERRRIAELVHGRLQQRLAAVRMQLGGLDEEGMSEEAHDDLQRAVELLEETVEEARSMSRDLSPPGLFREGLAFALEGLAQRKKSREGLLVTLEVETERDVSDENVRAFLYDATRELLFNVTKHAETNEARVRYRYDRELDCIEIEVADGGVGFEPERLEADDPEGGLGLLHLRERLKIYDGAIRIDSAPGEGCSVSICVPVDAGGVSSGAGASLDF